MLLEEISSGGYAFAISGTPGIGKSLFFVYLLHRFIVDSKLSFIPNRILYQQGAKLKCFDLQKKIVTSDFDEDDYVWKDTTLYVIDGQHSTPIPSSCITLLITSPRSKDYKDFVKQKQAIEWYFPVWTLEELNACRVLCYPDIRAEMLKERFQIYGGVARFVFQKRLSTRIMEVALTDVDAVSGVRNIGNPTNIFTTTHTLLHIIVSDDYQFLHVDIASKYVGEQLWIRHSAQMLTNLTSLFGGSPSEISRHLFEIYGHVFFSAGGQTLKCKCLEDDSVTQMTLDVLNSDRVTFGRDSIPTAEALQGKYYEPGDEDNFPAVDSITPQGMFQFTVAATHPIRGVEILKKLCKLYDEPKLFFVVPPHRFDKFKKQELKSKEGSKDVEPIPNLKQYVLTLDILGDSNAKS